MQKVLHNYKPLSIILGTSPQLMEVTSFRIPICVLSTKHTDKMTDANNLTNESNGNLGMTIK